jgi:hypothetical protein
MKRPLLPVLLNLALFASAAAVVFWQTGRVAAFVDFSYVLEHAYRMASGDTIYRDFPLVHAPGTFAVQALLIRLFDTRYEHHVIYCALVSGASVLLTRRILELMLAPLVEGSRVLSYILAAPLVFLGVYAVLPHAFYDPDSCALILLSLWLIFEHRRLDHSPALGFLAGVVLVLPIFFKQNIGLPYFGICHLALLSLWREGGNARRGHRFILLGSALALGTALLVVQLTVGLSTYYYWTIQYASMRRMPRLRQLRGDYNDWLLWAWFWLTLLSALAHRQFPRLRGLGPLAGCCLLLPFPWILSHAISPDGHFLVRQLLSIWPYVLMLGVPALMIWVEVHGLRFETLLPVVLGAAIYGTLLSQSVSGSTYGIWPLFVLLGALVLPAMLKLSWPELPASRLKIPAAISSACLFAAGIQYLHQEHRLTFVDLEGEVQASRHPRLKGAATRGDHFPELDAMLKWVEENVPPGDGIVDLPGEDPFHFALRRPPRFPLILFERTTTNPYSLDELDRLFDERDIRWIVLKQHTQARYEPMDLKPLMRRLSNRFRPVHRTARYLIYKRN